MKQRYSSYNPHKSTYFTVHTTINLMNIECIQSIQKTTIVSPTKFLANLVFGTNNCYRFSDFDALSDIQDDFSINTFGCF